MQDLRNKALAIAKADHGLEIVTEDSPAYESPSNGFVENACGQIKGTVRVLKHAAEELHNLKIDNTHPCLPWIVRYAAASRNRFHKSADGFTPWFRLKNKPYRRQLPSWGEKVLFLPAGKRSSRLADKFLPGIFYGVEDKSDEIYIGTPDGVVRACTFKRLDIQQRSDAEFFNSIKGTPWCPVPSAPALEEIPTSTHIVATPVVGPQELPPQDPSIMEGRLHRVRIRRDV